MIIKKILLFFLIPSFLAFAQIPIRIGGKLGGGTIKGNSPNQGTYFVSVFIDIPTPFSNKFIPRLSFIYAQDFDKLLPNNSNDYHSFVKGFSVEAVTTQNLNNSFYLEESAGLLALNDRIFSNNSVWDYGVKFSLLGGLDLRKETDKGFRIGLGLENGFTFSNTLVKYFSVYFQVQTFL
ncbi:MAG: hypothetical protein IIC75_01640 [Bacteroidetes bacterium]|nr:hypothetical protein [Bacteroidota bacterium]